MLCKNLHWWCPICMMDLIILLLYDNVLDKLLLCVEATSCCVAVVYLLAYIHLSCLESYGQEISMLLLHLVLFAWLFCEFPYQIMNLALSWCIVNSSNIQVENQSGLNLLCHFYDNQDVSIAGKHSSTILLRYYSPTVTVLKIYFKELILPTRLIMLLLIEI